MSIYGVPGVLADPTIELHYPSNANVSNDQWRQFDEGSTGLEDKLTFSGLAPQCFGGVPNPCDNESALWPTLAQGLYTVTLRGVNGGTGIGLIEFFEY